MALLSNSVQSVLSLLPRSAVLLLRLLLASSLTLLFSNSLLAQQDDRTPEEKAYQFRDGVFHAMEWKFGQIIQAKFAKDTAGFQSHAQDLAYLAAMIDEGFIANSIVEGSKAKAEIWEDRKDFSKRADELETAALALSKSDDLDAFSPRKFGGEHCGGCHRRFKVKEE